MHSRPPPFHTDCCPSPIPSVHGKVSHVETHGRFSPMYDDLAEAVQRYSAWLALRSLTRT